MPDIVWTDYLRYRAKLRNYDLDLLEKIVRHSGERYFDTETERTVIVGRHKKHLVMIPCEMYDDSIAPVTVHAITRQQISFRLRTGRLTSNG